MFWDKKIKKRILGIHGDILSDNLLVVLVGIHGNEHAGLYAMSEVFSHLKKQLLPTEGCIIALKGNLKAIEEKKRFIDKDLNRQWYKEQITYIKTTAIEELIDHEDIEQKELYFILEQFLNIRQKEDPFLFLDIHTTSAEGGFFTIVNDNDMSVAFAKKLEVPLILHLNKVIKNTTLSIFSEHQFSAIAFEAGQHESKDSVDRIKAAVYILMHEMKINVFEESFIKNSYNLLKIQSNKFPKETIFSYKHTIEANSNFKMKAGFKNFDPVRKGQILATDINGEIACKEDGYILMPLYQTQGEDGFFIIK